MSEAKDFPQLTGPELDGLIESLHHWSLSHGLVMYPPGFKSYAADIAPVTLYPTPFPRKAFEKALSVQQNFNRLYVSLASQFKSWLIEIIEELSKYDKDFTGMLYETYKKAVEGNNGKIPQPLSLGLFRSDYMLHKGADNSLDIKQIEFNTVSVSFGGLSNKVSLLHQFLNSSGQYDSEYSYPYYEEDDIPVSQSLEGLSLGLKDANYYYNDEQDSTKTVILFIVQNGERNCFDQRHVEYELFTKYGIKSYRLSLEEVSLKTSINGGKLYIKKTMDEVSVVYFRSGYSPQDYESDPEQTWKARLHLESSQAIKCPSILTQLSGTKKIQQVLTQREVVEKFLSDVPKEKMDELFSTFVDIYPLDDSELGDVAKRLALEQPERYVLKPQREGGGNNIYKENIPGFLEKLDKADWAAYILMELIEPPTYRNSIVRQNEVIRKDIISELGIFGTVLFDEDTGEIKENRNADWLLRSKLSSSNEGGVAAGFGCVDSIYLY